MPKNSKMSAFQRNVTKEIRIRRHLQEPLLQIKVCGVQKIPNIGVGWKMSRFCDA